MILSTASVRFALNFNLDSAINFVLSECLAAVLDVYAHFLGVLHCWLSSQHFPICF